MRWASLTIQPLIKHVPRVGLDRSLAVLREDLLAYIGLELQTDVALSMFACSSDPQLISGSLKRS
jgi:hypothetical protein